MIAAGALSTLSLAWAQSPSTVVQTDAAKPKALLISIIDGEGALNDVRTRTAREPIVEVDDENHKPVAGALVLFAIDNGGSRTPFATFKGTQTLTVHTDAAGHATASGFQVTAKKGNFKISVHAGAAGVEATAIISEQNVDAGGSSGGAESAVKLSHKRLTWIMTGVVVGAAVGGIVYATEGSSSSTITPGTGTVGAPAVTRGLRLQFGSRRP
jgi:hypothetical protein